MQTPDAHDRLLALALANMPPVSPLCILCEKGEPTFLGICTIGGVAYAYALCETCYTPTFGAKVEAHIRGWLLQRRRN